MTHCLLWVVTGSSLYVHLQVICTFLDSSSILLSVLSPVSGTLMRAYICTSVCVFSEVPSRTLAHISKFLNWSWGLSGNLAVLESV